VVRAGYERTTSCDGGMIFGARDDISRSRGPVYVSVVKGAQGCNDYYRCCHYCNYYCCRQTRMIEYNIRFDLEMFHGT